VRAAILSSFQRWTVFVAVLCSLSAVNRADAARPEAARLFPKNSFVYVRIADVPDLKERFQKTAFGRMAADPQIAPLVDQLFGAATQMLADAEEKLGMSVAEILSIPQGEIALAVVGMPEQTSAMPILLVDVGNKQTAAEKLIDSAVGAVNGVPAEEETYKGMKISSYVARGQTIFCCFKDGVLILSLDVGLTRSVLDAWEDKNVETLADNDRFAAVLKHCTPANGQELQIAFFADPISFVRIANPDSTMITAMLSTMGLDGLMGIGGSLTLADGEFDTLMHLHLLLDNPRTGVLGMIAITSGDSTPERWVPSDASAYLTLHWDVNQTYQRLTKVVDSFSGEGFLANQVRERSAAFGFDAEKELLPALAGRFTQANWLEKPITMFSQVTVLGAKLKDAEAFQKVLDNFVEVVWRRDL
jgi:hypothetical protein